MPRVFPLPPRSYGRYGFVRAIIERTRLTGPAMNRCLLIALAVLAPAFSCIAGEFHQEEFRIPFTSGAGSYEALLVRPDEPGRFPLARNWNNFLWPLIVTDP